MTKVMLMVEIDAISRCYVKEINDDIIEHNPERLKLLLEFMLDMLVDDHFESKKEIVEK